MASPVPRALTLDDKQADLLARFSQPGDWQERMALVVEWGRRLPSIPEAQRSDENRVQGCLSRLWLIGSCKDGRCHFQCDSDSAIVKGIAGILCEFYSGQTPEEVLGREPDFLSQAGITQHLTANRRNSLGRVREVIREHASAWHHGPDTAREPSANQRSEGAPPAGTGIS